MKYWKYVFFIYALMEISVGVLIHMLSPADIDMIHNQTGIIQIPAMFYVKSFGNAAIGLGIISMWAFLKNSLILRQGCAITFAVFNALATYTCFAPWQQAAMYKTGGFGHLFFAVLFSVIAIALSRRRANA
jgi:hypothetical protein